MLYAIFIRGRYCDREEIFPFQSSGDEYKAKQDTSRLTVNILSGGVIKMPESKQKGRYKKINPKKVDRHLCAYFSLIRIK